MQIIIDDKKDKLPENCYVLTILSNPWITTYYETLEDIITARMKLRPDFLHIMSYFASVLY